jgi:hypothetical protein
MGSEGNNTFQKENVAFSSFVSRGCDTNIPASHVCSFYSWKKLSLEWSCFVEVMLSFSSG